MSAANVDPQHAYMDSLSPVHVQPIFSCEAKVDSRHVRYVTTDTQHTHAPITEFTDVHL